MLAMKNLFLLLLVISFQSCQSQNKEPKIMNSNSKKTETQWKAELTPEQYEVLRNKGTERAFTGEYWDHFEKGKYGCAGCGNDLFTSDTKFDSHCGWPSFDKAIKGSVVYVKDLSYGMVRTEVLCAKCDGHLGHIFDDGPKPSGKRYCNNGVCLVFKPKG